MQASGSHVSWLDTQPGYALFAEEKRPELKEADEKGKATEVIINLEVMQQWNKMKPDKKLEWHQKAAKAAQPPSDEEEAAGGDGDGDAGEDEDGEDKGKGTGLELGNFQAVYPVGYGVGAEKFVTPQDGFRRSEARVGLERFG